MFIANAYADVFRDVHPSSFVDEFDIAANNSDSRVVLYKRMPIHITPFTPRYLDQTESRDSVYGNYLAEVRKNYKIQRGDILTFPDGRTLTVKTVNDVGGAFRANSITMMLEEVEAIA